MNSKILAALVLLGVVAFAASQEFDEGSPRDENVVTFGFHDRRSDTPLIRTKRGGKGKGGGYPYGGYTMGYGSGSLMQIPPVYFPPISLPQLFVSFPPSYSNYGYGMGGGGYGGGGGGYGRR